MGAIEPFEIIDLPYEANYLFLGIDIDQMFDDLKAYREEFCPDVKIIQVPYRDLFKNVIYRMSMWDHDVALHILAHVAPDGNPLFLVQPIIYDTPHVQMDRTHMCADHVKVTDVVRRAIDFETLSVHERYMRRLSVIKHQSKV